MRMIQKAAVVAAALGSIGFIGAGTAFAGDGGGDGGPDIDVNQSVTCKSHDLNVNLLSGLGNLSLGGLLGNEGDNGTQNFKAGSTNECGAKAF